MRIFTWKKVWSIPALVVAIIIVADQWTKYIVLKSTDLNFGGQIEVIPSFFRIVRVRNPGAAWGILPNYTWLLALISGVVFILMTIFFNRLTSDLKERCIGASLMMGGIAGNLIDRVWYGSVIDFLSFNYKSFEWPAFNVADSAICIGVALISISSFLRPDQLNTSHVAVQP